MKTKQQKREEAELRHDIYENMTNEQILRRLDNGGYRAVKERKRLGLPALRTQNNRED
jgi:hypothetical protein